MFDGTVSPDRRGAAAIDSARRRLVLLSLWDARDGLHVADVRPRSDSPERIERELRRVHLPMLEAAGYIEWDPETGEVRRGPNFEEVASLFEGEGSSPIEEP